jgi:hypothetical protein
MSGQSDLFSQLLTRYLRDPSSLNRDVPRDVRNILVARSARRPAGFN